MAGVSTFREDAAMDDPRAVEAGSGFTVVGVMEDGAGVSRVISELKKLGIGDVTVILKRPDPDEPEPFPEGTRYIVVPDDRRGLGLTVGIAAVFVVSGLLFAFTTPSIGTILFLFFIALAALLAVGTFVKVGVMPILIDVRAPAEESGYWNDEFERGKVLVFAGADDRGILRAVWEVFEGQGVHFDVVGRRLEPRPVNEAVLHRTTADGDETIHEEGGEEEARKSGKG